VERSSANSALLTPPLVGKLFVYLKKFVEKAGTLKNL